MIDINLFAGAGGLALALRKAEFSQARFYEIDHYSCEALRRNIESRRSTLSGQVHEGDIRDVDWRSMEAGVRLIAGAVPCQPFSLAGNHHAEHDGRNLFPEVLRAVHLLRPAAVLLENVRGLLRTGFQPYFEYVLRQLECPSLPPMRGESWQRHDQRIRRHQCSVGYQSDYHVVWRLLDAADFGVPQNRLRVFIVATRIGLPAYIFPQATHSKDALLRAQRSGEYWKRHGIFKPHAPSRNGAELDDDDGRLPWLTVRDALQGLPEASNAEDGAWMNHWTIPGARSYPGHTGSVLDWPSKTLKAGVHGVPGGENSLQDNGGIRYYTLREAARLQTFPDFHLFDGARLHVTRQIGNAVPQRLAAAVAAHLKKILSPDTCVQHDSTLPDVAASPSPRDA